MVWLVGLDDRQAMCATKCRLGVIVKENSEATDYGNVG